MMDINAGLLDLLIMFFDKNISGDAAKSEIMPNQQLAEESLEPVIGKFEKPKVYSFFEESI